MTPNPFDTGNDTTLDYAAPPGPSGSLPLTPDMLRNRPSGDLFGWTQNAGMGWDPARSARTEFLILRTQGGIRAADGTPIALGYHTGHWEVGLLDGGGRRGAAGGSARVPFAGFCTDPCDGRTQGTAGMFDSLPYRNDAATVFRRLIRSLPTRRGVLGVATCDKGLPAMMMALAGTRDLPCVLVPGGVTLPPRRRRGRRQGPVHRRPLRPRRDHAGRSRRTRLPRLRFARRRLPVPRHRRHVAGRRRGARPVAAALGARPVGPADLARHGPPLCAAPSMALEATASQRATSSPTPRAIRT